MAMSERENSSNNNRYHRSGLDIEPEASQRDIFNANKTPTKTNPTIQSSAKTTQQQKHTPAVIQERARFAMPNKATTATLPFPQRASDRPSPLAAPVWVSLLRSSPWGTRGTRNPRSRPPQVEGGTSTRTPAERWGKGAVRLCASRTPEVPRGWIVGCRRGGSAGRASEQQAPVLARQPPPNNTRRRDYLFPK